MKMRVEKVNNDKNGNQSWNGQEYENENGNVHENKYENGNVYENKYENGNVYENKYENGYGNWNRSKMESSRVVIKFLFLGWGGLGGSSLL